MSRWITPPEIEHGISVCVLPEQQALRMPKNSVWECDCGRHWLSWGGGRWQHLVELNRVMAGIQPGRPVGAR